MLYTVREYGEHKKINGKPHVPEASYLERYPYTKQQTQCIASSITEIPWATPKVILDVLVQTNKDWDLLTTDMVH